MLSQVDQLRLVAVGTQVVRVGLVTDTQGDFAGHIPTAHQTGGHLFARDPQDMFFNMLMFKVTIERNHQVSCLKMGFECVGHKQITKVVQQASQITEAKTRAKFARYGPD